MSPFPFPDRVLCLLVLGPRENPAPNPFPPASWFSKTASMGGREIRVDGIPFLKGPYPLLLVRGGDKKGVERVIFSSSSVICGHVRPGQARSFSFSMSMCVPVWVYVGKGGWVSSYLFQHSPLFLISSIKTRYHQPRQHEVFSPKRHCMHCSLPMSGAEREREGERICCCCCYIIIHHPSPAFLPLQSQERMTRMMCNGEGETERKG